MATYHTVGATKPDIDAVQIDRRWYALFVRPRHENAVATVLVRKGLEVFLPLVTLDRQWGRRRVELRQPMFPCYVFCQFDVSTERVPILSTPGVTKIVGLGRTATPVEESEIASLRRVVETGFASEPWPYSNFGQPVLITEGALTGVEGTLVKSRSQHRLVLSIQLLQRSVAVEIEQTCVESAKTLELGQCARRAACG